MLELLMSLTPEQQAALAGLVVSAVYYMIKLLSPMWYRYVIQNTKFRGTAIAVVLCALATLSLCPVGEAFTFSKFIYLFFINFATSQTAHNVIRSARK